MVYSDIEVLLEYFNSVVWFTQSEMLQGHFYRAKQKKN